MQVNSVYSLKNYTQTQQWQRFLVLKLEEQPSDEHLFLFSPHVMKWGKNSWIVDLAHCRWYWEQKAAHGEIDFVELIELVIEDGFRGPVTAVLADHPWKGVVFLQALRRKGCEGVYSLDRILCDRLYQSVLWDDWFENITTLIEHYDSFQQNLSRQDRTRSKVRQMVRFLERLCLKRPVELKQAEGFAIQKRFGKTLGQVWEWTYGVFDESRLNDALVDFPWRVYRSPQRPSRKRHLDYEVSQWNEVAQYLKEDLNRMCESQVWSERQKVFRLKWVITLQDLSIRTLDVSFRSPHSLHAEYPEQKTALSQAYFQFMQLSADWSRMDEGCYFGIVGWRLSVEDIFTESSSWQDGLFEGEDKQIQKQVMDLSNKLPCAVESFQLIPSFIPNQDYQTQNAQDKFHDPSLAQWQGSALRRPLYVFDQPTPLSSAMFSSSLFLEKGCSAWWQKKIHDFQRSYYLIEQFKDHLIWAFKTESGEWYQHGVFA